MNRYSKDNWVEEGNFICVCVYVTHNVMFSPNLNSVQLKCKWLNSHNYLYKVRGCGAMGDNISVYEHHKGKQSNLQFARFG